MKEIKYRICENAYGWFKIQYWHKGIIFKGKWKDECFLPNATKCVLFRTKEEALEVIQNLIEKTQMDNEDWKCHETYI